MAGVAAATTGVAATEGVFCFESCVRTNDHTGSLVDCVRRCLSTASTASRLSLSRIEGIQACGSGGQLYVIDATAFASMARRGDGASKRVEGTPKGYRALALHKF